MSSVAEPRVAHHIGPAALLPLVVLPIATVLCADGWPSWVFMWAFAFSIYAGLKWLSFADCPDTPERTAGRSLGYLLLWPGMDAKSFFDSSRQIERPGLHEGLWAAVKVVLGLILVVVAVLLVDQHRIMAGWVGMAGIVFTLHFGLFHLLSVIWRRAGIDAPAIMDAPVLASSLSDFWGRRWNLAFRDLAHTFVFRPFVGRLGIAGATIAVFLASGVVHDVVISVPAGAGFGLPTLYFLIQGLGVLFERSQLGKRIGTRKGLTGRLFYIVVVLGPVFLLFHQPFVERVMVPMLTALGNI